MNVRPQFVQRQGCPLAGRRVDGCCAVLMLAIVSHRCTFSVSQ
jgi:hypothetical protein